MTFRPAVILSSLLVILPGITTANASADTRQRLSLDHGWRFQNGDPADAGSTLDYPEASDLAKVRKVDLAAAAKILASRLDPVATHLGEKLELVRADFNDSSWGLVDLPHDWAVELPFDPKANFQHGFKAISPAKGTNIGWYRRSFELPGADSDKSLSLEFDGVYRNSLVWLNGHCLGRHPSGYTSFTYDISKVANYGGTNTLIVRADATRTEGWFYEGAGIYRHVWLVKTEPVHIAHWGTYITSGVSGADAEVEIQTTVSNDGARPATVALVSTIVGANGKSVGESVQRNVMIEPRERQKVNQKISVSGAHLWSPQTPVLYKLISQVNDTGGTTDTYETSFGIRTLRFDADKGFLLNGQHVEIKGTCNHQDHAGVGAAMPDRLQYFRIEKLKEMGSNAYRTSHNPPTPELLDACDQLGMLVMDETRRMGNDEESLGQLESMMLRDRNHPSVFVWSIGNEESRDGMQGDNELGVSICRTMQDAAHRIDPSRQCTVAMNGAWGLGFSSVIDIQGFNYVTRGGRMGGISVDDFHAKFPDKPCIGTEDGSTVCTRGEYADDAKLGYVSAYDKRGTTTAEKWWAFYQARPFLPGSFVWTGFDYRGEPTPYKWPCISSQFGIMDTCGFPKDNYYYYQAVWSDKTVLHILPHWNWKGREGREIEVWAYSNCDEVELFLDGQSQGRQKLTPNSHVAWKVQYAPGTLLAKGVKDGKQVATDQVETTGEPASLLLTPDRAVIRADGSDLSIVNVSALDANGRAVPTADNEISFDLTGPGRIIGVGNGDPTSHEPDKATKRKLFNGLAQVIVQSTEEAGTIQLTAVAQGLKSQVKLIDAQRE